MPSPEKQKPLSEILSESCSDKEKHAEFTDRPCPNCGHINAHLGSAKYMKAVYQDLRRRREQTEKEESSQPTKNKEASE